MVFTGRLLRVCIMENGTALQSAVIEAENELQYLQEERRRVSLQRKALRQLQKNEKRKKDRLKRKAAKLSRKDLLELALQALS